MSSPSSKTSLELSSKNYITLISSENTKVNNISGSIQCFQSKLYKGNENWFNTEARGHQIYQQSPPNLILCRKEFGWTISTSINSSDSEIHRFRFAIFLLFLFNLIFSFVHGDSREHVKYFTVALSSRWVAQRNFNTYIFSSSISVHQLI